MTISLSTTEFDANASLRAFLLDVLPTGTPVIRGQANRVPEPASPNFVVMTPIRRTRLAMNFDEFVDAKFTGSIVGNLMTIASVAYGSLKVGSIIFGLNVADRCQVVKQVSGSVGGTGVYQVSTNQVTGSIVLAAGVLNATQATELTVQLDIHGPLGGDNAQVVTTLLRDPYGCDFLRRDGRGVTPLTADNRGQMPFINAEQAWEDRWIVDACLQINATVQDVPQQFFDSINVERVPVDIEFVP